jgi:WD40-like Beta Propeller Repeat
VLRKLLVAVWCLASPALAQRPSASWRTVATPHFRVHYTAPDETWALDAASKLEAIRSRVAAEVGYAAPEVTDVIVADPAARANGMALPILGSPRMVLWASPPGPASAIGTYRDWVELLALHEETHLEHMLRPSRDPWRRIVEALLPLGPIALDAPRWLVEGYATLVEGALTGSGRPNSDLRAAILREKARAGALPTYAELAGDRSSWLGTSMAYLEGSAYLEWLVERSGPDSLRHLWARMTARTGRGFEQAFAGVFGERPETLYGRFTAELTWRAVEAERRLAPEEREGTVWQALRWTTGEPAVSPDGRMVALVLRDREAASRLVVWRTGPDLEAERAWSERAAAQLRRDPEDVAPVRARPLPRAPLHELVTRNGAEPFTPRWMPDGRAIVFVRFETDADGVLHPDLFRWEPGNGRVTRLTRFADVREADPAPDGRWVVAVRDRHGLSQLVRVELADGSVSALTPPSLADPVAQPRVSPDGGRVAFVRHRGGAWELVVRTLGGGETGLPAPAGATVADPAWSADGKAVIASVGRDGFIDLMAFPAAGGAPRPLTRTIGAALAPAPTPDGAAVFFLSLRAGGLDLSRLELGGRAPGPAPAMPDLGPAVRPPAPPPPPALAEAELGPGHPYGVGRQEITPLAGGSFSPSGCALELGVRAGDVVGRLDTVAIAGLGDAAGPRGGTLAAAWRGWPLALSLQLFSTRERPSRQPVQVAGLGDRLDLDRRGLELAASRERRWDTGRLRISGGLLLDRLEPASGGTVSRRAGFLAAAVTTTSSRGRWRFPHRLEARIDAGSTGGGGWRRYGGSLELGAFRNGSGVLLLYDRESERDARYDADRLQLGGVASSLLPSSELAGRLAVPALPAGTRIGDEHEGERATVTLFGVPLFFARHRVWSAGEASGGWLRLVGVEWALAGGPSPLVRLPGFELTVGAARVLDPRLADRTQAWLALGWRP